MMVIMKPGHTREQFEDVMNRIREVGLDGHPIVGVERTVIGVVGMDRPYPELADDIEVIPGVETTVPISTPSLERSVIVVATSAATAGAVNLPSPKSTILSRSSPVTIMFRGFRSRCTMPAS